MKIIVSHDVDHLFRNDHYQDLIYPKLWIRSTINLFKRECTIKEWSIRMASVFNKKQNNIQEVMEFDFKHSVPSTFFFGMSKGLGMSYGSEKSISTVKYVEEGGFDVGVHGISFESFGDMKKEFDLFKKIVARTDFGIRMHYVRYTSDTFKLLSDCGYLFDTSEFNKLEGTSLKAPYKVGEMWEFPLMVMDGYLPNDLEGKKRKTIELITQAEKMNLPYFTILFHDCFYNEGYIKEKAWYEWIIKWLKDNDYDFISYKDAITELEKDKGV